MHIYTYPYISKYTYACMYTYVYIHMNLYTYIYLQVYICSTCTTARIELRFGVACSKAQIQFKIKGGKDTSDVTTEFFRCCYYYSLLFEFSFYYRRLDGEEPIDKCDFCTNSAGW